MADKKVVIAPLKERLKKLYEVGKLVTFTDEAGDFSIWLFIGEEARTLVSTMTRC